MKKKMLIALLVLALLVSGCSQSTEEPSLKALCLVPGQVNDDWTGANAYEVTKEVNELLEGSWVFTVNEMGLNNETYEPTIKELAKEDHDVIILYGQEMYRAGYSSILNYPEKLFIAIDAGVKESVENLVVMETDDTHLGFLAGLLSTQTSESSIGWLGGSEDTKTKDMYYGFLQGLDYAGIDETLSLFTYDYNHYSKAKEYTSKLAENGAGVVASAVQKAGLGALDAAGESDINLITVADKMSLLIEDSDRLAPLKLSIIRNQEIAVSQLLNRISKGESLGGKTFVYGIGEGAMSIVATDDSEDKTQEAEIIKDFKQKLEDGDIVIKNARDDIEGYRELKEKMETVLSGIGGVKYSVEAPYHEVTPNVPDTTSWKEAPRINLPARPSGWLSAAVWATFYLQEGADYVENVGIEISDFKLWGYSPSKEEWRLLSHALPQGAFYYEDFRGDDFTYFNDKVRLDEDNLTTTILLDKETQNRNFHPFSEQLDLEEIGMEDLSYVISQVSARLVKWDEDGPDNLEEARYCFNVGGDWWVHKGATWKADWSANSDMAIGQYLAIAPQSRTAYMTTVPSDMYDTIVPDNIFDIE